MSEYLIQDTTLIEIANAIRNKTEKTEIIKVSNFAHEINSINIEKFSLPVLDAEYPEDTTITVLKGDTAQVNLNVSFVSHGNPAVYTYQWYENGNAVEGATESSYTKTDLSSDGTYSIYCEVTNEKGTVTSRIATLNVTQIYTPTLNTSYPANTTIEKGKSVTSEVTIATDGNPTEYTYQWYKDGSAVSGATSSSYSFTPSATGDTQVYCKVTNSAGTVTSRTATISTVYTLVPGTFFDSLATSTTSREIKKQSDGSWYFWSPAGMSAKKDLSVSNYNTMTIKGSKSKFEGTVRVGLFDGSTASSSLIAGFTSATNSSESFNKSYDISKITGTKYFGVYGKYDSGSDDPWSMNVYLTSVVFK